MHACMRRRQVSTACTAWSAFDPLEFRLAHTVIQNKSLQVDLVSMSFDIRGKTVIITGANSGIGRYWAE